jgi:exosortase A-associated hydrolase 2
MAALMPPATERHSRAHPLFLELNGRRLFGLQIVPTGACTAALLYLPPFVEEMNRCRSHVVLQARALAARGCHCLLLDPHGTGESEGQITEADWDHWRADAEAAGHWLRQQTGQPLTVWGIRTGALLAAEMADRPSAEVARLLFWQPVLDGTLFLNQYLRLRIASQLLRDGDRETTDSLRTRLSAGEDIEVAGYPLTGRLADSLASRRMADFNGLARCRIDWIEVVAKPEQSLSLPSRKQVEALTAAGARVATATVACPMIWQLQERGEAQELQAASLRLMGAMP